MVKVTPTQRPLRYLGADVPVGKETDVADDVASEWIRRGLASKVSMGRETAVKKPGEKPEKDRRGRETGEKKPGEKPEK